MKKTLSTIALAWVAMPLLAVNQHKVSEFADKDPYGVGMALIAMGVVFGCLLFLYVFFHALGWVMTHLSMPTRKMLSPVAEHATKTAEILLEGKDLKGIPMETYAAVIGLALHDYYNDVHDVESGVLTLAEHEHTDWNLHTDRQEG